MADDKQKNEFVIIDEDLPKRKRKPTEGLSEGWRALIVLIVGMVIGAGGLIFAASFLWEPLSGLTPPTPIVSSTQPPIPRPTTTMPLVPATYTPDAAEPTHIPISAASGWELLFVADSNIYRVNSENQTPSLFASMVGDPQFSPDGTRLAYTNYVESRPYLTVAQSDGSNAQEVSDGASIAVNNYYWSPDGTMLAYSNAWRIEGNDTVNDAPLRIFDVESGTSRTLITDNMDSFPYYQWSPDSQRIAFMGADYLLYVVDVQTGDVTGMSDDLIYPALFQWSADSTALAYVSYDRLTVYIIPIVETNPSTNSTYQTGQPVSAVSWSPDGTRFAVVSGSNPPLLQVMNPDDVTANPLMMPLPGHNEVRGSMSWVGNNRLIMVLGLCGSMVLQGEVSSASLYSVDLGQQQVEKILDVGDYACGGSSAGRGYWSVSPDGSQLAYAIGNFSTMGAMGLMNLETDSSVTLMDTLLPYAPVWRP